MKRTRGISTVIAGHIMRVSFLKCYYIKLGRNLIDFKLKCYHIIDKLCHKLSLYFSHALALSLFFSLTYRFIDRIDIEHDIVAF